MNAAPENPILQAALAYAARGWPVLPCSPVHKRPLVAREHDDDGKPIPKTGGLYKASTDPVAIRAWWKKWPKALIGLRTGRASGLLVVDLDPKAHPADVMLRALAAWCGGVLPPAWVARTRAGGLHLYFSYPGQADGLEDKVGNRAGGVFGGIPNVDPVLAQHVDVRGEGGYVIVPPSVMVDGRAYHWEQEPDGAAPADMPARLLDVLLHRGEFAPTHPEPPREPEQHLRRAAGKPDRTEERTRRYALAGLDKEAQRLATCGTGQRNQTLFKAALAMGQLVAGGALSESLVRSTLEDAAVRCGLVRDDGWDSVRDTFASGFQKGLAEPRDIADKLRRSEKPSGRNGRAPPPPPPADPDDGDRERPTIYIRAGEVPRVVDETEAALLAAGSSIYSRGCSLVRPVIEPMPASNNRTTMVTRFRAMCAAGLADHAARVAHFLKFDKRSDDWVPANPPADVVAALLAREGEWRLLPVSGLVTTPTLRPDGSILSRPGYDSATRLFLALDPAFRLPPIPDKPTRADAERSREMLVDVLSGFPFVGRVDRAVALSGILTAVLRPGLPAAPAHIIKAYTPATGKSYLVDLFSVVATGRPCPVMAMGQNEEETEKRLGALLLAATPVISIDNVNGDLGGDALCQMSERPLVRVRILGKSETPEIECRSTIFATGNNITVVGDMVRRSVLCTLDAGVERPELRQFDFDPIERVQADRAAYVAAAITIVRAYRAAEAPAVCAPLGSYGAWSNTVRSALVWLGEADPVASMEAVREEDPELGTIRELFSRWREHLFEDAPYTSSAIVNLASERDSAGNLILPDFHELLLRIAAQGPQVSTKRLGRWLTKRKGRIVEGRRLDVLFDEKHGNRFVMRRVGHDDER